MCKKRVFAVILGVLLTVSGYAQTNQNQTNEEYPKAGFFFGAGMSNGIFTSDSLNVYSDFAIKKLSPIKIGAYYELPLGIGNFFAGLEGGFASGTNFGGEGGVDFLPVNLNATFAFNIADIIFIGPGLKAGILGILGHEKYNFMPLLGAGLDLELRYKYFPLSIYATGGVNAYPTTNNFSILPTVEAGIRIPRGSFGRGEAKEETSAAALASGAQGTTPAQPTPVAVVPAAPTVTSLTVTPAAATVNQGATQQFTATVTGTNNPPQTVTWTVVGAAAGTSISPTGLLTVGPNQTPGALTVRATSTADTTRSGTAAVTVPTAAPTSQLVPPGTTANTAPTVTTIIVNPVTSIVPQGFEQHFTAIVEGTNDPPQTVTWSVTGGAAGTSINQNGLLTVGPNQPAGTLTVRATSTADTTRSGTSTVTVPAPTAATIPPATVQPPAAAQPPAAVTTPPSVVQPPALASGRRDIMDTSKQSLFAEVHFEPDTAVLIESTRSRLEAAGRYLQANPSLWVLVRTYTAPFGTAEGRFMVALDRARFCRDYLIRNYGIAPERIVTETLASERLPENVVIQEWITYRTAELIMIAE